VCLSAYSSICLSVCPSVCLSVCVSVPVYLCVCLPICMYVCLSVCLYILSVGLPSLYIVSTLTHLQVFLEESFIFHQFIVSLPARFAFFFGCTPLLSLNPLFQHATMKTIPFLVRFTNNASAPCEQQLFIRFLSNLLHSFHFHFFHSLRRKIIIY